MAISSSKTSNIYEDLKYKFLFKNDINSIHILLNLYDLENNISYIFPKYFSLNNLRNSISKLLKNQKGKHLIASNLGQLIHEDINRLELYLYLEGYRYGYLNNKYANHLESITIKYYSISELYNLKYLFHFNEKIMEIIDVKNYICNSIKENKEICDIFNNILVKYTSNIIKTKILSLNKYLDKQLEIDYNSNSAQIKEEGTLLTREELLDIYKEVEKIIIKNGYKIYNDAYWYGINDRVLKRYS